MPRVIEIVLFLTPFLGFAAWRLAFPSPQPPRWLVGGAIGCAVLFLLVAGWIWFLDARDANQPYVPAELRGDRVVPGNQAIPR